MSFVCRAWAIRNYASLFGSDLYGWLQEQPISPIPQRLHWGCKQIARYHGWDCTHQEASMMSKVSVLVGLSACPFSICPKIGLPEAIGSDIITLLPPMPGRCCASWLVPLALDAPAVHQGEYGEPWGRGLGNTGEASGPVAPKVAPADLHTSLTNTSVVNFWQLPYLCFAFRIWI